MLLQEMEATCQSEHEDRQREKQKKMECRSGLLGQMEYNERRRCEDREEEARMVEKQKEAQNLFEEEVKYLLANPFNLKWNPKRKQLLDEHKISCS